MRERIGFCGTIRANIGLPKYFIEISKNLKTVFCRKDDVLFKPGKAKTTVSILHQTIMIPLENSKVAL